MEKIKNISKNKLGKMLVFQLLEVLSPHIKLFAKLSALIVMSKNILQMNFSKLIKIRIKKI